MPMKQMTKEIQKQNFAEVTFKIDRSLKQTYALKKVRVFYKVKNTLCQIYKDYGLLTSIHRVEVNSGGYLPSHKATREISTTLHRH